MSESAEKPETRGMLLGSQTPEENQLVKSLRFIVFIPYNATICVLMTIYKIDTMLGAPLASAIKRNP